MINEKENPSQTALKVVKSEASTVESAEDKLRKSMQEELNVSFIESILDQDKMKKIMVGIQPFLPMLVGKLKKVYGKDEVRFMTYFDEETESLVFQRIHTANIAEFKWHEDPKAEDFFIIQNKDLNNPGHFLKAMMKKFNLNLF